MTAAAATTTTSYREAPANVDTERRWERAKARGLALLDMVCRTGADTWIVPSQSDAGTVYTVTRIGHPGSLHCECLAAQEGQPCAHVAAVVWWIKGHNARLAARRQGRAA